MSKPWCQRPNHTSRQMNNKTAETVFSINTHKQMWTVIPIRDLFKKTWKKSYWPQTFWMVLSSCCLSSLKYVFIPWKRFPLLYTSIIIILHYKNKKPLSFVSFKHMINEQTEDQSSVDAACFPFEPLYQIILHFWTDGQ